MYKVIHPFHDMTDGLYAYKAGDTFPRKNAKVDEARIKLLASDKNAQGRPLIEEVKEKKK